MQDLETKLCHESDTVALDEETNLDVEVVRERKWDIVCEFNNAYNQFAKSAVLLRCSNGKYRKGNVSESAISIIKIRAAFQTVGNI